MKPPELISLSTHPFEMVRVKSLLIVLRWDYSASRRVDNTRFFYWEKESVLKLVHLTMVEGFLIGCLQLGGNPWLPRKFAFRVLVTADEVSIWASTFSEMATTVFF